MNRTARSCLALALTVLPPVTARAQTIWTPLDHRATGRVELWHPHFDAQSSGGSVSTTSGPLYFSFGFPVNEKVALAFELPYTRASVRNDPFFGDYSDNTVGNPYVGVQLGAMRQRVSFVGEIGARVAAVSQSSFLSSGIGMLADPERLEAFAPKSNTLAAAGNVVIRRPTSSTRFRLGVTQLFSSRTTGFGDHMLLDYGAQSSVDVDRFRFGGALSGRYAMQGGRTAGNRSTDFAVGSASYSFGTVRPSLSVRLPFERDVRNLIPWTLGLGVEVEFR